MNNKIYKIRKFHLAPPVTFAKQNDLFSQLRERGNFGKTVQVCP